MRRKQKMANARMISNIFSLINYVLVIETMASKLIWYYVNMTHIQNEREKKVRQTTSHLFTQWQFPCSLNCYDFLCSLA